MATASLEFVGSGLKIQSPLDVSLDLQVRALAELVTATETPL